MTKSESLQHKLERVRPPRVRITFDVETGAGLEMKEIPFVVGALADLSGKPDQPLPKLKDRKFVEIDRDNFNSVLGGMKPRLVFKVDNKLANDSSQLAADLRFRNLEDFRPEQVALQVEPLRKLIETRRRLSDLLNKLDGNDRLGELLQEVLSSTDSLKMISYQSEDVKSFEQETREQGGDHGRAR